MLELKHISYAVREGDSELGILNDISLTIDDHRLVVFTGPNGGGRFCGTVRISRTWESRSGPVWASATASSSPPGSRG